MKMKSTNKPVVWLLSMMLALSWLLPNHYQPWTAFHAEAWSALAFILLGLYMLYKCKSHVLGASPLAAFILIILTIPLVQYIFGQIHSFGTMWMSVVYLYGFGLAIQIGYIWAEKNVQEVNDFLFFSILIAALLSVLIEFYQAYGLNFAGIWIINAATPGRLYANLAQSNQLATLICLALVGILWGFQRSFYGKYIAIGLSLLLMIGLALTGSRTVYIMLTIIVAIAYIGKKSLDPGVPRATVIFFIAYVATVWLLSTTESKVLYANSVPNLQNAVRTATDVRVSMWQMFIAAINNSPWSGYGWGQVVAANFQMASISPDGLGMSSSAHNLAIDMLLWMGWPTTLLILSVFIFRFKYLFKIKIASNVIPALMLVGCLLVHSMLELPLHYAYFLLPFGMMLGVIDAQSYAGIRKPLQRNTLLLLILVGFIGYSVTVVDYLKVERTMYLLRYQERGIQIDAAELRPKLFVLHQFASFFHFVTANSHDVTYDDETQELEHSVISMPSAKTMYTLAAVYALQGENKKSANWQMVLCKTMPEFCEFSKAKWRQDAYPNVGVLGW